MTVALFNDPSRARCAREGCTRLAWEKSLHGYCRVCAGAAKDAWRSIVRQKQAEVAGRRAEAEHFLEAAEAAAEEALEAVEPGGTGAAWVEVRPANTSFAYNAKRWGWKPGPRGGVRFEVRLGSQAEREAYAVAMAAELRRCRVDAFAVLDPWGSPS